MLEMEKIYPVTALQKKQSEVRAAAKEGLVRITENGMGAYVFCSEDQFMKIINEAKEQASYEALMAASIERAREDYAQGRYTTDVKGAFAQLQKGMTQ